MMIGHSLVAVALGSAAMALALPQSHVPAACMNGPHSRKCWGNYSIDTDWYTETPYTGVVREYWFLVENTTVAPDGYETWALTVNRSIPGPTIEANWGDEVIVHVTNGMERNGTAIHFHGLRQLGAHEMDGVPGVTQCPIAPGHSYTYKWRATQYGTSWYHSHFSMQYSVGLQGPIVIHGPATADYDEDLGTVVLQDWSHTSPFAMWWYARVPSGPPSLSNSLINGKNVFYCDSTTDSRCYGNGTRSEWRFEQGKKYRMRLINTGLYSNFRFAIDNHNLTVIATDFVPIKPYTTDNVAISMGQRYDIVVEANQPEGDYWLRAIWQTSCCPNDYSNNTLGIIRYTANSTAEPNTTSPALSYPDTCGDEPAASLVPHLALNASTPAVVRTYDLSKVTLELPKGFLWTLNDTYLWINWSSPTNLRLAEGGAAAAASLPAEYLAIDSRAGNEGRWAYLVFNDVSARNRSHPMHLHGHDFFLLGTGPGYFEYGSNSSSLAMLNLHNPPRRDTATWPESGWMVVAFLMDNPGSWLIHCHIAWHSSESLGLQFLESPETYVPRLEGQRLRETCEAWDAFWNRHDSYEQEDAGI